MERRMITFLSRVASTRRSRLGVSRQQRRKGDRLDMTPCPRSREGAETPVAEAHEREHLPSVRGWDR
jgi:hypothetical protein